MSYWPEAGGAWGCQVNAHRAGWNGTICNDPCNWDCGAKYQFRSEYCDRQDDRCYQVYLFDPHAPWFIIDEKGVKWLLDEDRHALDGQILFLFTHQFQEPGGAVGNGRYLLAGVYVVSKMEEIPLGHKSVYKVTPQADFAVQLADLRIPPQRYSSVGRPYMRHFDSSAVTRMRQQSIDAIDRTGSRNDRRRDVLEKLDGPLKRAAAANDERRRREGRLWVETSGDFDSPFKELQNFKLSEPKPAGGMENRSSDEPRLSHCLRRQRNRFRRPRAPSTTTSPRASSSHRCSSWLRLAVAAQCTVRTSSERSGLRAGVRTR